MVLMTQSPHGLVSCLGDGVNSSISLGAVSSDSKNSTSVKKTGLWFDQENKVFKCQSESIDAPTVSAITCRRPNECELMRSLLKEVQFSN